MQRLLLAIFLLFCLNQVWAQNSLSEQKRRAQEFYAFGRFEEARAILSNSRPLSQEDKEGRFLLALCYYQLNQLDQSALLLNGLIKEEKTPYPECWLYMGKIFHARHQFEKAAEYYKAYLKLMDKGVEKRRLIWDEVERCANGLALRYKEQKAFAENLGVGINTKYDEFAPVVSPTRNDRLYFSSARVGSTGGLRNAAGKLDDRFGRYTSDMYAAQLSRGTWGTVTPMDYLLNSPQNDILLDIRSDGGVLYYFQGDGQSGRINMDTFQREGDRLLTSDLFPGPIDPGQGDFYPHFVNDTLIYFASTRAGGYGGYDIYRTSLVNGRWQSPQNLGPDINTPYDETMPFQARDMRTLYYSTDHPAYSIGGLDVVKSVYLPNLDRWSPPQNLGLPINSAGDDGYFRLNKDGFSGFLSSSRKDGIGQRDLYAVYFQDFLEEMEPPTPPAIAQTTPLPANELSEAVPPVEPVIIPEEPPVPVLDGRDQYSENSTTPPIAETMPPPKPVELPETTPVIAESTTDEEWVSTEEPPASNVAPEASTDEATPPALEEAAPTETRPRITPLLVEDGSTLDTEDRNILQVLAKEMLADRDHRLVITTYSNQQLNQAQQINEGINLSESVALYLFQQGVPTDAVFLRAGLADLSKAPNQGRLVAFNFAKSGMTPKGSPEISLENPWLDLTVHKLQQELTYKVQVAASRKNDFNDRILEEYIDPMIEKQPDFPYYRYTVGAFGTFKPARQLRGDIAQFGLKSAFPVPYLNGWRLEGAEIVQKRTAYPDLQNYLGGN